MADSTRRDESDPRALTIRQPWVYAITHLGKDVENRSWRVGYRGLLVLHAGIRIDRQGVAQLRERGFEVPDDLPTGVIIGAVELLDIVRDHPSPWSMPGAWHWVLGVVRRLDEPVPAHGQQRLWRPEHELYERIMSSLAL